MMKKVVTLVFVAWYLVASAVFPPVSLASSRIPAVTAHSAIVMDPVTGRVIYGKNIYERRPAASLTKIMTAMVVLDRLPLTKKVCVSRKASLAPPSKVYLQCSAYMTVKDLLHALLLNSGNDAAICLAEAAAGSEWQCARLMTAKAQALGAKSTRFINASGLPGKGQFTTAYDLALIMKAARNYPFIRQTMAKRYATIRQSNGKVIRLRNHNKLLWRDSAKTIIGKTGYTRAAGRCFLGLGTYGKRTLVVCVLGAPKMWADATRLLNYAYGTDNLQALAINRKLYGARETKNIQRALHRAGCSPGKVDGRFGLQTLNAICEFQRISGLRVDGIVGGQTLVRLKKFM